VHSAVGIQRGGNKYGPSQEQRDLFAKVWLLIVDEVSMVNKDTLEKLEDRLRQLANHLSKYGGINMVFVGDFRQLDPVGKFPPLYQGKVRQWYHYINTYVELKGSYRFGEDKEWGEILKQFRDGVPLKSDFDMINSRVLNPLTNQTFEGYPLPANIPYATYTNKERDAINTGLFAKQLKDRPQDTFLVLAD